MDHFILSRGVFEKIIRTMLCTKIIQEGYDGNNPDRCESRERERMKKELEYKSIDRSVHTSSPI